jgi:acyl-[acyl-carrier-protein]-phospholipid O-acyltransferase/long-chain-fatty-acid--[acyl-carrier-protein] ligase
MKSTQLMLLNTRRFLPLFLTQFLGAFNDNTFKNALVILITYRLANLTGLNSQMLVTLAAGIFILPFFLFSATAGDLADKIEKSRLISIIKFIEIILMIAATAGFYLQSVPVLMSVLFALGAHATFFGPLKYALLPEHLYADELVAGNGLIEAGTFISILLGTIIGGVFILQAHGEFVITSLILSFAVLGWITSLYIPKSAQHANIQMSYNIFKETKKLIQYSCTRKDIFLCILGISWFWLVGSIFLSQFPVLAKDVIHAKESIVTVFLAIFSIGLAIGSMLCNKLLKGKIHATYVPLGILGITLFTIDFYFAAQHVSLMSQTGLMNLSQFFQSFGNWRMMIDLLLLSICSGIYTVPLYALLQHRSSKEHCARVIASNNVINALFMVMAAIITMLLLKIGVTVIQLFLILAIANGIVGLYICKLLPDVFIKGFFYWILTLLYKVKVKGIENYHNAGDHAVIIANHTSFIDAILLATFLPDKLTFAADITTAKKWWVKPFLRLVNVHQVDPTNSMAIKSLINVAKQEKRCVIFPEGRLTTTGNMMKVYEGAGMVADKANAKLLPISIQGAQLTLFSRLKDKVRRRWMPTITITIFPAQTLDIPAEIKGKKRRQHITSRLSDIMTNVIFDSSSYQNTLFSSLLNATLKNGSRHTILEDIERTPLSYQALLMRCFILGRLIAKSTQPGEHVGILLPNMNSTVITFFALQAFCRVPAMLNYSAGSSNVLIACQTAQIQQIYTSRKFIELAKLTEMVETLQQAGIAITYLEDFRSVVTWRDKIKGYFMAKFPQFFYQRINATSPELLDANSTAVILFTSGSEGTPKGVVLSHANIQANICQLSACVDFNLKDKILNSLPLFHSFGLTAGTLLPVLSGVYVFLYPSPLHYRIIPEVSYGTNATILFGTDTFLSGYARYAHQYDFYSVRYIFAGAEKLKDETRSLWTQKFGVRIFEGYGATETSPVISTNTPLHNKAGTVGRMLPGMQYKIDPVPGINEGGALSVTGPNIMKGYLLANQPGVLVPPKDNWYETGDIVAIDEAGFITIVGRAKRFAKIAGEMVSLTMVESQITKLWPDHQHAVISIPDAKKGEQLILFTTYAQASREEVVMFAKATRFGEIAIPKKIVTIAKMPLLGSGKIDYAGVKELLNH